MTTPYGEHLRLLQTYGDPVRIDGHHTTPGVMATREEHAAGLALEAAELRHTIAIIELRKAQLDQLSDQWPDDMPLGDFIAR